MGNDLFSELKNIFARAIANRQMFLALRRPSGKELQKIKKRRALDKQRRRLNRKKK